MEDNQRNKKKMRLASCDGRKNYTSIEDIPNHLMSLVAKRMRLPDLFRFGCVCKAWSCISRPLQFANHLPWLIVPLCKNKRTTAPSMAFDGTKDVGFFSLRDDTIYTLELPELYDRRICGSLAGGWLMTAHQNSEIQLINPFSCSSPSPVYLPPLTKFPDVLHTRIEKKEHSQMLYKLRKVDAPGGEVEKTSTYMRDTYIVRAVMSTSSITKGTIIMVIYHMSSSLAYYRIGGDEQNWTLVAKDSQYVFRDLTHYKGKFYAVQQYGHVVVVHSLEEARHGYTGLHTQPILPPNQKMETEEPHQYYILESAGDLLVVFRYLVAVPNHIENLSIPPYRTVRFSVCKIEFASLSSGIFQFPPAANKWVEIYNLGEYSLFIGRNSSFSIPSSKFTGCKPNCIYFTDIFCGPNGAGQSCGGYDLGIYNLEDGTIEKFLYPSDDFFIIPPPVWFAPNL